MNFINLATMDNPYVADQLAETLTQHGIKSRMHDESSVQRFVFLTKPKGFSIVQVPETDYARAISVLQELQDEQDRICDHIFSCPECGSLAVEYPQFTRKYFITPLLLEWASNLGLFKKEFYCRKCHWTWAPIPAAERPKISRAPEILVSPPD